MAPSSSQTIFNIISPTLRVPLASWEKSHQLWVETDNIFLAVVGLVVFALFKRWRGIPPTMGWNKQHIPRSGKTCCICSLQEVENEKHLIFQCPAYYEIQGRHHYLYKGSRGSLSTFYAILIKDVWLFSFDRLLSLNIELYSNPLERSLIVIYQVDHLLFLAHPEHWSTKCPPNNTQQAHVNATVPTFAHSY